MSTGVEEIRVVLVTAPDARVARTLARALVEERLAACVSLVPGLTSIYRWEAEVQEDPEVLMLIKSTAAGLPALEARVLALHPYDTPEFMALTPSAVEARYGAWLLAAVDAP